MKNPIFVNKGHTRRVPVLQISILKIILSYGELSKTDISDLSQSHYPDISNAVKSLVEDGFIELVGKKREIKVFPQAQRRRGHPSPKLYKLTQDGLTALLSLPLSNKDFWKAIIILYSISNGFRSKFEARYYQRESDIIGYSSKKGYIIDSVKPYELLATWLKAIDGKIFSDSQKILECLALNGSLSFEEIAKRTKINSMVIDNILRRNTKNSVIEDFKVNVKESNSQLALLHDILIIADNKTRKFELSLFGILLVMTIVRHSSYSNKDNPISELCFLHNDIGLSTYFDKIADNYKDKLPLIFGKWKLLRKRLGKMLYDSFDFMLDGHFQSSFDSSILSHLYPGNREFYDDFIILAQNTQRKLSEFSIAGNDIFEQLNLKNKEYFTNKMITKTGLKLSEIEETLNFMELKHYLRELASPSNIIESTINFNQLDITKFEDILAHELTFLFYINMNMSVFMSNKQILNTDQIYAPVLEFSLGHPKFRLLYTLAEDKEIKDSLLEWIKCIITNREKSLNLMKSLSQEFSDTEMSNVEKRFQKYVELFSESKKINAKHEEFDISKIIKLQDSIN